MSAGLLARLGGLCHDQRAPLLGEEDPPELLVDSAEGIRQGLRPRVALQVVADLQRHGGERGAEQPANTPGCSTKRPARDKLACLSLDCLSRRYAWLFLVITRLLVPRLSLR